MHLKMLEDQAREQYQQNLRAMTKAAAEKNIQNLGEKQSREAYMRQYEATRDQTDLARVNATTLNPTASMTMGTSGRFGM